MCGIAGVLYSDARRSVTEDLLTRMGDAIAHRGPDGVGTYRGQSVGLVHRRLAIIDLAGGQQPLGNEDDSLQIVFNGEIYNYRELRKSLEARGHLFRTNSDTEVLVHLFEDLGPAMCRELRGMFAFAIWNTKTQELFLARDHLGQKPLYIYRDHEKLLFGSELKAILAHGSLDRAIRVSAVEDFLTFGFVPGSTSIFQSIEKLPAGHSVLLSPGRLDASPQQYWRLEFKDIVQRSNLEWKECIDEALKESVKAHLVADVPVGAFLSGGLDSSAIVATASRLRATPLQTFSIGFQEKEFSELPYAEAVARHFCCLHTEEIVTPDAVRDLEDLVFLYDEPFADASAIPTMAVARMAAQHVKVALSGDGGDELFGGYARYSHDLKEASLRTLLPGWFRQQVLRRLGAVWPKADWLPRALRLKTTLQNLAASPAAAYANTVSACRSLTRRELLNKDLQKQLCDHAPERIIEAAFSAGARDPLSGMLAADTSVLLPDDFLTKVDRASMGFGLEVRPPLIDWKMMELAASMPSDLKVNNGSGKWILKQVFESRLPDQLVHRRKQGFELPIDIWLRGPLRNQVHEIVLKPDGPLAQFISISMAERLYGEHCAGRGRHGQVLWSLLILGRWLDSWGNSCLKSGPQRSSASRRSPMGVSHSGGHR
ncbi:MAG: asparagine synthase (glutamine-hydrolyzing) [Planctomyces sp.]|nr:asparagine synthase (glutamine-hydrolyzing) [Planctomyces sp.]